MRSPRPSRGAELELSIESLAHGGSGVARHDGYVVFVRGGGAPEGARLRAPERQPQVGARRHRGEAGG
ncbi:MAG: TRAM domain-containing protein [Actinobacteria bacterium]|nr:MAG: TRAM domain-containing protein [Actinomycetota bacterium]